MKRLYGYADEPDEFPEPVCPVCGNVCDKIYLQDGDIIGCNVCVAEDDPCEYRECFGGEYGET